MGAVDIPCDWKSETTMKALRAGPSPQVLAYPGSAQAHFCRKQLGVGSRSRRPPALTMVDSISP